MRKITAFFLSFVFVLGLFTNINVYAINDTKDKIDYAVTMQKVKSDHKEQLNKIYQKKNIQLDDLKVTKKVKINKLNDLETIKRSYEEPVLIYQESVQINSVDDTSLVQLQSTESVSDIDIQTYSYYGTVLTLTTQLDAKYIVLDGEDYRPMKISRVYAEWESNNQAGDGEGGGVDVMDFDVDQIGNPYNHTDPHPIDDTFSVNTNEFATDGTGGKYYSYSEYTNVLDTGSSGALRNGVTYQMRFETPTTPYLPPDVTYREKEVVTGFGALPY